jgi:dienelactone hydrolase family protein
MVLRVTALCSLAALASACVTPYLSEPELLSVEMQLYLASDDGPTVLAEERVELSPFLPPEISEPVWDLQRAEILRQWQDILGPSPERVDLDAETLSTEHLSDHTRHLVRYQTEPGVFTEAYLLVPNDLEDPAPAAVVFHSTSDSTIRQPVGLADPPTRHLALWLVRRGYVTISPRCFIWSVEGMDFTETAEALLESHPGWTGMGKMLWDGIRAIDFLESRPEVDPARIASVGHSLGAKESLYLAAFDPRIRAAVSSEGGIGLSFSNWDAPWYLGPGIRDPEFRHDHHELVALIAPRPFLLIGGEYADGAKSWPYLEAARPVYRVTGDPADCALLLHDAGHHNPLVVVERAFDWLDRMMGEGER